MLPVSLTAGLWSQSRSATVYSILFMLTFMIQGWSLRRVLARLPARHDSRAMVRRKRQRLPASSAHTRLPPQMHPALPATQPLAVTPTPVASSCACCCGRYATKCRSMQGSAAHHDDTDQSTAAHSSAGVALNRIDTLLSGTDHRIVQKLPRRVQTALKETQAWRPGQAALAWTPLTCCRMTPTM